MTVKHLIFSLIILFLLDSASLIAQETFLPHYMTEAEKALYPSYQPPLSERSNPYPPTDPVRGMAEWEKLDGIMIAWTSYYDILVRIIDYAQEEGKVYIVCQDSNQVKNYLTYQGVPLKNLKFLIEDFDTIWCRDYGPWSAYSEIDDSHYIIDWIYNRPRPSDDTVPAAFADFMGLEAFEATQSPNDLVHTGGNLMVDGHGTAFSSELILEENSSKSEAEIDDIMNDYLGVKRYIKMPVLPYDEIHHIDMHMKLLDEETLLVGEYPSGVADGPQIEANLQYVLDNFTTCYGNPYRVVRIPMPPDASGLYPDQGGDYRTYTNSVIINKTVIVPTYEEQYDSTALRIYREAMPGYHIVGIDCNEIITSLGAIHCITKEVGAPDPIFIAHNPLRHATVTEKAVDVYAQIKNNSGIDSALTFWSTDTSAGFTRLSMQAVNNDSFYTQIPAQAAGTTVFYYLRAVSQNGNRINKPPVAPAGLFSYTVQSPSAVTWDSRPAPHTFRLFQNTPNPFRAGYTGANTSIRYQLASAGHVKLSIYNLLGQKINTLYEGYQTQGIKRITWNGQNDYGSPVSAGVYFYCLKTEHGIFSRKMIIIP